MSTAPIPGLAETIARARHLTALGDCPDHPDNHPARCGHCRSTLLAANDTAGLRAAEQIRAMAACDDVFPRRRRDAVASHPTVVNWARRTAGHDPADGPPRSLLILGCVGRGKTYQAYGALRILAFLNPRLGWSATTYPDLLASLRPRPGVDPEAEMDRYRRAGVLLVDDLGTAKDSAWTEEVTYRLVDHRYDACAPTIYVSNLGQGELRVAVGDRIASRLAEACVQVVLDGQDRRRLRSVA